jgi:hypothetical protein
MEFSFDGQVALVTGAAAGMGLATARPSPPREPPSYSPMSTRMPPAARVVGVLCRQISRANGGRLAVTHDVQIDGFKDVGCGQAP